MQSQVHHGGVLIAAAVHPHVRCTITMRDGVNLRGVVDSDVSVFLQHQLDAEANRMVGSAPRPASEFLAHWAKTSNDPAVRRETVVCSGLVAGYVGSFERAGKREVCYWLGREFWGKGVATRALINFLKGEPKRPLYARVAKHNVGSVRVLEKCGFIIEGADRYTNRAGEMIDEFIYRLDGTQDGT